MVANTFGSSRMKALFPRFSMRKTLPALALVASTVLASCGTAVTRNGESSLLDNPLFAEWYYKDLVENMMNLEIQNDPLVKDAAKKSLIDDTRTSALAKAQEATAKRQRGMYGIINPVSLDAKGQVLLIDGTLYFGPDTTVLPGPSLHVFLSLSLDPRSASGATAFPVASDSDLGVLRNPYGASTYAVPANAKNARSVVLFDTKLKRIYAFAQLRTQR